MSRLNIDIDLDNDAFAGDDLGPEVARILRGLADQVEHESREDLDLVRLRDVNGNKTGLATFYISPDISKAKSVLRDEDAKIRSFVGQMTRDHVVMVLQNFCGIECFDGEHADPQLEALVQCIHDGITSIEEIQAAFSPKY